VKTTRIFLFASPLLLLVPPLFAPNDNPGWIVFSSFYGLIIQRFPWNLIMAGICYNYAHQLGRDAFVWAGFSFFFPFLTPLILAFRSPKYNSTADVIQRMQAKPGKGKAITGSFKERFPLLERCLQDKPDSTRAEQKQRFDPVPSNFEFTLPVDNAALSNMLAEASTRRFTVWTEPGASETQVYGAGLVEPKDVQEFNKWLRGSGASGGKLTAIWVQPDGVQKVLEFYAA
jgi:hypothetical protein